MVHHKSTAIPRPDDSTMDVTGGSTRNHGIDGTLYITRNGKHRLANVQCETECSSVYMDTLVLISV